MESANHATGESSPQNQTGRPASPAQGSGPGRQRDLAERIADARAMVAYQDLGGGVRLTFKVRPLSVAEAAQAGSLSLIIQQQVGRMRQPAPEDMTGLQAAQAEAAQGGAQEQVERFLRWVESGKDIARRCVTHVQDLEEPEVWRRVIWVRDEGDQGEDDADGDPVIRLHLETILDQHGLTNIVGAAAKMVEEVADRWGRFRR